MQKRGALIKLSHAVLQDDPAKHQCRTPTAQRSAQYREKLIARVTRAAGKISFQLAFVGPGGERWQPEHLTDRCEGAAMDRRDAEAPQGSQVLRHRIAFVACEAITGMLGIELVHQGIARRL